MTKFLSLVLILLNDGLTADEFQKLHAQLQPSKNEPWRTIPWKVSLLEARDLAARQKKPVFLWAMDGHPLGGT